MAVLRTSILLALAVAISASSYIPGTTYYRSGGSVYFWVYRVHNSIEGLGGDNAASPGGEVGFLSNQYTYTDGQILQDCVEMKDTNFAPYECCNGGSCGLCNYAGTGTNTQVSDLPGRCFQLYPPPGAPCSQTAGSTCSGAPSAACDGDCSGFWYSFPSGGECKNGDPIGTNGCSWRTSPVTQVVQWGDLLKNGFVSCEQNYTACQGGNLAWKPFSDNVEMLIKAFKHSTTHIDLGNNGVFTQTQFNTYPKPYDKCRAPCPKGYFSSTGYVDLTANSVSGACTACPVGTYNTRSGQTQCQACGGGASTPGPGATKRSDCGASSFSGNFYRDNTSTSPRKETGLTNVEIAVVAIAAVAAVAVAAAGVIVVVRRRRASSDGVMMTTMSETA